MAAVVAFWLWRRWSRRLRDDLTELAAFSAVDTTRGDLLFAPAGTDEEVSSWYHARVGSARRLARAVAV